MKTIKSIIVLLIILSLIGVSDAATSKVVKPTVTFTANKVSGTAPLSVAFTSKTTGSPTSYYWTFIPTTGPKGNDWNSYHAVTAAHTFTTAGKYTITLLVKNSAGSATYTKTSYITVTEKVKKPVAIIGASTDSWYIPAYVQYYDLSTGNPTKWLWSFGDGSTSTKENPLHLYKVNCPNHYCEIKLTVWNSAGSSTTSGVDYLIN